jgi:hypothetical protein
MCLEIPLQKPYPVAITQKAGYGAVDLNQILKNPSGIHLHTETDSIQIDEAEIPMP